MGELLKGHGPGKSAAGTGAEEKPPAPGGRSPAAERALAEAAARRAEIDARVKAMPKEHGGRKGPEPVRYGDWEKNGLASDF